MQEEINTVNPETPVEVKEVEKVSEAVIVPEEKVGEVTEAIVSAPVEEVKQVYYLFLLFHLTLYVFPSSFSWLYLLHFPVHLQ